MKPAVSIIVLNYKGREDTLACLRSLEHLTYPNVNVIIVDNDSGDGTVEAVRSNHAGVKIIETGANLGFSGGNNVGIRYALKHGADYVLLLNNDTVVAPDMLDVLVAAMQQNPAVGVVGPTIYYYSAPETIWSAGGQIDWARGTTQMIGLNEDDHAQYGIEPRPVDFVTGCALLAKREVWEKAGLLDESFFMYYEETEWCVRASRAGFQILHVPMAMMWHRISIEARAASPRTHYYMTRNRLLFLHRTGAGLRPLLATLGEYGRTLVSWSVREQAQDKRPLRGVMLRALKDFSLGRYGQMTV